jgi:hypothetical protein
MDKSASLDVGALPRRSTSSLGHKPAGVLTMADLSKKVPLNLSLGHLLVVWEILSNKLPGSPFFEALGAEEQRALFALQDLSDRVLLENGISALPMEEWDRLVQSAREHVASIPIDYESAD